MLCFFFWRKKINFDFAKKEARRYLCSIAPIQLLDDLNFSCLTLTRI